MLFKVATGYDSSPNTCHFIYLTNGLIASLSTHLDKRRTGTSVTRQSLRDTRDLHVLVLVCRRRGVWSVYLPHRSLSMRHSCPRIPILRPLLDKRGKHAHTI